MVPARTIPVHRKGNQKQLKYVQLHQMYVILPRPLTQNADGSAATKTVSLDDRGLSAVCFSKPNLSVI